VVFDGGKIAGRPGSGHPLRRGTTARPV
jgi:hypothetical protein